MIAHARTSCALVLFGLLLTLAPAQSFASWYPPDYRVCSARDVRHTGPFELIRDVWNFGRNGVALTVAYRGELLRRFPAQEINFYIRLNGQDVFMPAWQGGHGDAYVFLRSGARDCGICVDYLRAAWPACDAWLDAGRTPDWVCNGPSEDEQELFTFAFDGAHMSVWDIEVAAEAHGQWDSQFGQNFAARFEARHGCYQAP